MGGSLSLVATETGTVGLLTALCREAPLTAGGKEEVEEGGVGRPRSATTRGAEAEAVASGGGRRKGFVAGIVLLGERVGFPTSEAVRIGGGGCGSAFISRSLPLSHVATSTTVLVALGSTFHTTGSA